MPAYLDHSATTAVRPEAAEAMIPWLTQRYGNPSGTHAMARAARSAIEKARQQVADLVGVSAGGVIFTGCGTEADNLGIYGVLQRKPGALVTSSMEHKAVLDANTGTVCDLRRVPVTSEGIVDLDSLAALVDKSVSVISVMLVNNEVGTIQPLAEVAERVRRRAPGAVLHTDAIQATSWLDVEKDAAAADLISISAHKFGGPQGIGALAVRGKVDLAPLVRGGGQERNRRSGTHNVAGIVGMGAAAKALLSNRDLEVERVRTLRDRLADGILAKVADCYETGDRSKKIAGNCHLIFKGVESEALLFLLDDAGIYASAGSSCSSNSISVSHVLLAMGIPPEDAKGGLRMTLGRTTDASDIDLALEVVPRSVARLRQG